MAGMRRLAFLVLPLALLALACGDDDDMGAAPPPAGDESSEADADDNNEGETDEGDSPADACNAAFAAAADVGDMEDSIEDLYPAVRACSLEDWTAASEAHPDALDGADPEIFARNVCQSGDDDLADSLLCQQVLS